MKKLLYTIAVALLAGGCTEDFTDWAQLEPNPEDAAPVEISFSVAAASSIDFNAVSGETVQIIVPSISAEGLSSVTYGVTLSDPESAGAESLVADASGNVEAAALRTAIENLYGKRPVEHVMSAAVEAVAVIDGVAYKKTGATTVTATLSAPFISEGYYLLGDMNEWNLAGDVKFSNGGGDVYDNPVFTVTCEVTTAPCYWKIAPKENHDAESWDPVGEASILGVAVDGDTSLKGNLVSDNAQAGKIEAAGIYRFSINMMDYTYEITKLEFREFLYVPGNHQGWAIESAPALRGAKFDGVYTGYMALDGEFKFSTAQNWNEPAYGKGSAEDALDANGGNLSADEAGFYHIEANLADLKYTLTKVETFSLIGPAVGGWETDVDMTYDPETKTFSYTGEFVPGEFKFRVNHGWDFDFGGSLESLSQGGPNLSVTEAGTYTIVLYPTYDGDSHCTVTKQ